MWEVAAILLCLGEPAPGLTNCRLFRDTRGPYTSQDECVARAEVVWDAAPPLFALSQGWTGATARARPDAVCVNIDTAA